MKKNTKKERCHHNKSLVQKNIFSHESLIDGNAICSAIFNQNSTIDLVCTNHRNTGTTIEQMPNNDLYIPSKNKVKSITENDIRLFENFNASTKKAIKKFKYNIKLSDSVIALTLEYAYDVKYNQIVNDTFKFIESSKKHLLIKEYVDTSQFKYICRFEYTDNSRWHVHLLLAINSSYILPSINYNSLNSSWEKIIRRRKNAKIVLNEKILKKQAPKAGNIHFDNIFESSSIENDFYLSYLIGTPEEFSLYPKNIKLILTSRGLEKPKRIVDTFSNIKGIAKNSTKNPTSFILEKKLKHGKTLEVIKEQFYYDVNDYNVNTLNTIISNEEKAKKANRELLISKVCNNIKYYKKLIHSKIKIKNLHFSTLKKLLKNDYIVSIKSSISRKNKKGKYNICIYYKNKCIKNFSKDDVENITSANSLFWEIASQELSSLNIQNQNIWIMSRGQKGILGALNQKGKYAKNILNLLKKESNRNNTVYSIALIK